MGIERVRAPSNWLIKERERDEGEERAFGNGEWLASPKHSFNVLKGIK